MKNSRLLSVVLLALAPLASSQSQVFVDASAGDDGNAGTQSAPFRTLTRATDFIQTASSGPFDRYQIVAAAGVHDAGLGESFPITFASNVTLAPADEMAEIIIDGDGAAVAIVVEGEDPVAPDKGIRGLTIRDAETGILVEGGSQDFFVGYLYDCAVEECTAGLRTSDAAGTFPVDVQWSGGIVRGCFFGVRASGDRWVNLSFLEINDMSASGVLAAGIRRLTVVDCVFENGDFGISANTSTAQSQVTVRSSIFSGFVAGIATSFTTTDALELTVDHCTFAGCSAALGPGGSISSASIVERSVLVGNFGTFLNNDQNGLTVRDCLVESTSVQGQGLLVEAPGATFENFAGGDFRLRRTSAAVDALPPTLQDPNPTDGNLDTVGGLDMGAIQLETLEGPREASVGTTITLDAMGDPIGSGFGVLQPRFSSGAVQTTVYGLLRLEPGLISRVARLTPDPATGMASWSFSIPIQNIAIWTFTS
ncbi:MAG: right-handed parallel beta-helix repeat-containing protein [Planctomycetota bacterium]